jgi:hypothetical protein
LGAIFKDMPQVSAAVAAHDFCPYHAVAAVPLSVDVLL